jgi:predicted O-methyltransferase YrrM
MNDYKLSDNFNFHQHPDILQNFEIIKNEYKNKDKIKFLEIGSFEGRSAVWFLDNVLSEFSTMYIIEPRILENFVHNMKFHKERVYIINDLSQNILPKLVARNELFDFIYIDGMHNASHCLKDIIYSWDLLKVDGILLIDDYEFNRISWTDYKYEEFEKYKKLKFVFPKVAIDSFLNIFRGQYDLIIDNYQIGVRKILNF